MEEKGKESNQSCYLNGSGERGNENDVEESVVVVNSVDELDMIVTKGNDFDELSPTNSKSSLNDEINAGNDPFSPLNTPYISSSSSSSSASLSSPSITSVFLSSFSTSRENVKIGTGPNEPSLLNNQMSNDKGSDDSDNNNDDSSISQKKFEEESAYSNKVLLSSDFKLYDDDDDNELIDKDGIDIVDNGRLIHINKIMHNRKRQSTVVSEDLLDVKTIDGEEALTNGLAIDYVKEKQLSFGADVYKSSNDNEFSKKKNAVSNHRRRFDEEDDDANSISPSSLKGSQEDIKSRENSNNDTNDDSQQTLSGSSSYEDMHDKKSRSKFRSSFLSRQYQRVRSISKIFDTSPNKKDSPNSNDLKRLDSNLSEISYDGANTTKLPKRGDLSTSSSPINMPRKKLSVQSNLGLSSSPMESGALNLSPSFRRMSFSRRLSSLSLPASAPTLSKSSGSGMSLRSLSKFRTQAETEASINYLLDKQLELVQESKVLDRIIIGGAKSSGKSTIYSQMKQIIERKAHFDEEEKASAIKQMKSSYLSLARSISHSLMDSTPITSFLTELSSDKDFSSPGTRTRFSSSINTTPLIGPFSPGSLSFEASELVKSKAGKIAQNLVQSINEILSEVTIDTSDEATNIDSSLSQYGQTSIPTHIRNLLSILELVPDNVNISSSIIPWVNGSGLDINNIYEWFSMSNSFEFFLHDDLSEISIAETVAFVMSDSSIQSFCMNEYKNGRLRTFPIEFMLENALGILLDRIGDEIFELEGNQGQSTKAKRSVVDLEDEIVLRAHMKHDDSRISILEEKNIEIVELSNDKRKSFSYLSSACKQFLFVVNLDALDTLYESIQLFSIIVSSPFLKEVAKYVLVLNKLDCLEQKLQGDTKAIQNIIKAIHRAFKNCYDELIHDDYIMDQGTSTKAPFACFVTTAIDRATVDVLVKKNLDDRIVSAKS